jgi:hypothetical protein
MAEANTMTQAQKETGRIYCNYCRQVTNHQLIGEHSFTEKDGVFDDEFNEYIFRLWICAGCERGTLESGETFMGGKYGEIDEGGNQLWSRNFYPKRSSQDLGTKQFIKLKPKLAKIYRETVNCFNNNALLLCTAGLRALQSSISLGVGDNTSGPPECPTEPFTPL